MRIANPQETLLAAPSHFWKRRSVFRGLGAKNCRFFRRVRLSGPGGKELKAQRKEFKAKRKEMKTQHKEMKLRHKEIGSAAAGLQVLGGNSACGYSGGWTNLTSTGTKAPLLNSASLPPTVLGNPGYAELFDGTAASRASYGSLDAKAHGKYSGSPMSYTAGTTIAASVGAATFSDTLTASVSNSYTDLSSSGFVRYRFAIDGSMTTPPPQYPFFGGEALTAFDVQQNGGPIYSLLYAETSTNSVGSFYAAPGGSAGWTIGPGSVVGDSVVELQMFPIDLLSSWSFTAGLIVNAYGNADDNFYSTARLVGIDLFDANGNAITDYSLFSGSGTNYFAPAVSAPEPGTLALMVVGAIAVSDGGRATRRRQRLAWVAAESRLRMPKARFRRPVS